MCSSTSAEDDVKAIKLSVRTKASYSLGHVLNDFCSALWFTYLLVYFQYVLKMESTQAGTLLLIGQIVDGITTPLVGMQIGRKKGRAFCCGKPYKGWHIFGTICTLASFPLLFLPCFGCEVYGNVGILVWYGGFVVLAQIGWAIVQISHMAMIPVLARTDSQRVEISSYKNAAGFVACVVVYLVAWLIFGLQADVTTLDETNSHQLAEISFICHGIGILCSLAFWIGIQEDSFEKLPEDSDTGIVVPEVAKKSHSNTHWFKQLVFYSNLVVFTSGRLFGNLAQVYLPMYLQVTLALPPVALATIPLTLYISGFLASMSVKWLRNMAANSLIIWGAATLGIAACAGVWLGDGYIFRTYIVYVVAASFGASGSLIYIMSLTLTANLIGERTGSSGFVYGIYSFADKVANGLVVFTIQYIHPERDSIACAEFYRWILPISCSIALTLTLTTQFLPQKKNKSSQVCVS